MSFPAISLRLVLILAAGAVLAGCRVPAWFYPQQELWLVNQDPVRAAYETDTNFNEWRDARRITARNAIIPTGGGHNDVLRVGFLAKDGECTRLNVELRFARTEMAHIEMHRFVVVDRFQVEAGAGWTDKRLELDIPETTSFATEAGSWVLAIRSDGPYAIGPCEVLYGRQDPPPNVLIVLIDTLRQDHVGCYGYGRDTTPHLDAFAEDAVVMTKLVPQSSWTRPSVASLWTSTYPQVHGAEDRMDPLRDGMPSMAHEFAKAGYSTHAVMTNANCLPAWNMGLDFAQFVDVYSKQWLGTDDAEMKDQALAITALQRGGPWFMHAHAMGPHAPYKAPDPEYAQCYQQPEYAGTEEERKIAAMIDAYDGEIAYTDAQFGKLIAGLKEQGQYDNTAILVIADHGEQFMEHGELDHGRSLHEEELRVPCILKLPGGELAGTRSDQVVEMIDVAPTLLEIAGISPPAGFEGESFLQMLRTGAKSDRLGYASLTLEHHSERAVKGDRYKYINDVLDETRQWYDLDADPGELEPQSAPYPGSEHYGTYAERLAADGASGFHMLITGNPAETPKIVITLRGEGLGDTELRYPSRETSRKDLSDGVEFTFVMHPPEGDKDLETYFALLKQDYAQLHAVVEPDTPLSIKVTADGELIDKRLILAGAERTHIPLDGAEPIVPSAWAADPDTYDPITLTTRFAVHMWYVEASERRSKEELDPGMKEALEGLGYL